MKKILLMVSGLMLSASVFAVDSSTDLLKGDASGTITKVSKSTGTVKCDALSTETDTTPVKVGLSKENYGSLACSTLEIGVAVTNPKGKGKVYSSSTGGGSLIETICADPVSCVQKDATDQAVKVRDAASS